MSLNNDDTPENPWSDKPTPPSKGSQPEKPDDKDPSPFNRSRSSNGRDRNDNVFQHRRSGDGNPLDDLIEKIQSAFKSRGNGGPPSGFPPSSFAPKMGIALFTVGALVIWFGTGFFRVQEGEVAVVLRFGEINRTSSPGLRYRLPSPIETEIVKKVAVLNKIDGGIRADTNRNASDAMEQNLILTGDENMVHTNYTVLWKIKDVAEFLFTARDPESTIRVAAESSIREILGQTTARLALTEGRETIGVHAQELLQKILDMYKMGVQIVSVQLQRVEPPVQVIQAFNDMQASLVDADRLRNEAEAYRNDIVPRARGEAEKIIQDAEGYQQQIVAQAEGDASRFNAVLTSYKLHPEVTMKRAYFDTMQQVLKRANKTIVDGKTSSGIVPYFNLQRDNKKPQAQAAAPEKGDAQ